MFRRSLIAAFLCACLAASAVAFRDHPIASTYLIAAGMVLGPGLAAAALVAACSLTTARQSLPVAAQGEAIGAELAD